MHARIILDKDLISIKNLVTGYLLGHWQNFYTKSILFLFFLSIYCRLSWLHDLLSSQTFKRRDDIAKCATWRNYHRLRIPFHPIEFRYVPRSERKTIRHWVLVVTPSGVRDLVEACDKKQATLSITSDNPVILRMFLLGVLSFSDMPRIELSIRCHTELVYRIFFKC